MFDIFSNNYILTLKKYTCNSFFKKSLTNFKKSVDIYKVVCYN